MLAFSAGGPATPAAGVRNRGGHTRRKQPDWILQDLQCFSDVIFQAQDAGSSMAVDVCSFPECGWLRVGKTCGTKRRFHSELQCVGSQMTCDCIMYGLDQTVRESAFPRSVWVEALR